MAAVVEIVEKNGAGGTPTTKTSSTIRFKNADDANVDLNNPIVRPGAGSVYSYEKVLRLSFTSGPTGSITSPRAFSDGSNGFGTGVTMKAGGNGAYVQPVNTVSAIATTDLFTYTAGAPLALDINLAGPYTGTGEKADYLYLQAEVASTASPGLTPTETLTIAYDET
jgi:hypothetical protein